MPGSLPCRIAGLANAVGLGNEADRDHEVLGAWVCPSASGSSGERLSTTPFGRGNRKVIQRLSAHSRSATMLPRLVRGRSANSGHAAVLRRCAQFFLPAPTCRLQSTGPADNRRMEHSTGITLAQLASAGRCVVVQCGDCPNRRLMRPNDLGLPLATSGSLVRATIRCSECGSEHVLLYPESSRDARKGRER